MEIIEAPKVQPSAYYSLLCDESENGLVPDKKEGKGSTAPGQEAADQVC
jgi:hypothetical protein